MTSALTFSAAPALPRRTLWALAGAVLIGHLVLLQTVPAAFAPPDPMATRAFTTRTIVRQAPAAAEAATTAAAAAPAAPRPRPVARPLKPRPAQTEPTAAEPAPSAVEPVATAVEPAPAPTEVAAAATPAAVAASGPVEGSIAPPDKASAVFGPTPTTEPAQPTQPEAAPMTVAIPGSTRLKYDLTGEVKKQTYYARGELLWLQDGKTYDARLEVGAFLVGSRVRTSSGTITDRGLAPNRFADKWRSEVAAHFERDKGRVSFSANTPSVPLLADAQDQLSVLLQLAAMVAGDPARYGPGSSITLPVVGMRDADVWVFTVLGEEKTALPSGETMALKLMRNPRREFDQKIEAWLSPKLGYLPVRFRITQANSDFIDQQLRVVDKP